MIKRIFWEIKNLITTMVLFFKKGDIYVLEGKSKVFGISSTKFMWPMLEVLPGNSKVAASRIRD